MFIQFKVLMFDKLAIYLCVLPSCALCHVSFLWTGGNRIDFQSFILSYVRLSNYFVHKSWISLECHLRPKINDTRVCKWKKHFMCNLTRSIFLLCVVQCEMAWKENWERNYFNFLAQNNIVTHIRRNKCGVCVSKWLRLRSRTKRQKSIWSFYMEGICASALIFSCLAIYSFCILLAIMINFYGLHAHTRELFATTQCDWEKRIKKQIQLFHFL